MKLFVVYLGGRIQGCHIEMHDVRFVAANTIEEACPKLKQQWVGDKNSVHMDSYTVIEHADGYAIELTEEDVEQAEHLYFVNLGGYKPDSLAETHDFGLFVATSADEAKEKAKALLLNGFSHIHKDDLHDVDDCFAVDLFDQKLNIKLTHSGQSTPLTPLWFGYHPL
ncbi:DUF1543 domain-containing protein [Pseudoalteromonas piscicida]|uniref:DUF1543 domain-containing protein n=1 Tax=Pseudoalteromonas piscicida TaxID=43662 RepID=UPI000E35DC28|nr:DUF1543 domain-containing protein [Pseudoalteromonas piscicida]AXQ98892.1 DUF1543 domain-containing protein [Pseudoalteromonas piscicida]